MSLTPAVRRGACALVLAFASAAARAGGADAPAQPAPGATPDATAPASTDAVELPEVEVRLPRSEASGDPTASATVIVADRYAGEAKQVAELVATAPGVAVNDYGGLGQLATASIRGSTADGVLVLLDGLPLNTAFGGGVDLSTIPRHWIDRLEVVRGAEGARYGSGALGGVLEIVTRRPEAGTWSAEASGGSFGTFSGSADGAGSVGGFTVLGAASADTTTGRYPYAYPTYPSFPDLTTAERAHNGASRTAALLKTSGPVGDARVDALAQLSAGHREVPAALYSSTTGAQDDGRAVAMVRLSGLSPAPGVSVSTRVHGRLESLDARWGETTSRQRGAAAGADADAALAHRAGTLAARAEVTGETLDASGVAGRHTRATLAASVSEDLVLAGGRVRLSPALRADRVGPFGGWSAKLGGSVRLSEALTARASGGRTFRAPSFAELYLEQGLVKPNPALRPEDAVGGDAALVLDGGAGMASVGAYASLYRDLILYDLVSLGQMQARNMGRALVSGLEAEAATAPARALARLTLSASYTLLVTENLEGAEAELGKWMPHRARHRLFARAAVAPGPFGVHVEGQYVGRQYLDTRNVLPVPAALVWSCGASARLPTRPPVALALEVRNALDDRTLRDAIDNPLPGRMVMLTVRAGATAKEGTP